MIILDFIGEIQTELFNEKYYTVYLKKLSMYKTVKL